MRISTNTLDEFLENLDAVNDIFEKTVWVNIFRNPVGGKAQDALKWTVNLMVGCVAFTAEESEFILEHGSPVGVDYEDTKQYQGTNLANELKQKIAGYAKARGWRVLPGIVNY